MAKTPHSRCRGPSFDPWVRKIPPEEEMATHSSIAWEILWTEEPVGLDRPWGRKRVGRHLVMRQRV